MKGDKDRDFCLDIFNFDGKLDVEFFLDWL